MRLMRCAQVWALLGGAVLLSVVAVTVANVGLFTLDAATRHWDMRVPGLPGYEDFVRLVIGPAALMMLPYCQCQRGHLAVEFFTSNTPVLRHRLQTLWRWVTVALALFLCGWMVLGMLETRADGVLSGILGWSEWFFYIPGIVSLILWAAVCTADDGDEQ